MIRPGASTPLPPPSNTRPLKGIIYLYAPVDNPGLNTLAAYASASFSIVRISIRFSRASFTPSSTSRSSITSRINLPSCAQYAVPRPLNSSSLITVFFTTPAAFNLPLTPPSARTAPSTLSAADGGAANARFVALSHNAHPTSPSSAASATNRPARAVQKKASRSGSRSARALAW